ncbi:hypothetical protein MFIFM68171_08729 [Madurella fahalii]|uniref:Uncharacterized protein n=1 Tax=Madurella fahalii TaxID=1157608 RepID=A0ABQ0GL92_9PEZI
MATFTELESRLMSLPLELDTLYERIIGDMRSRLTAKELLKSRKILVLVAGAGSLGRPLRLQELWEALAVPLDAEPTMESKSDPIIANRVIISSWADFRRQLVRYCEPLIEVIKVGSEPGNDHGKGVKSDDRVQVIHKTVKDFLEKRQEADEFYISEDAARSVVKRLANRYPGLAFPRDKIAHWASSGGSKVCGWKENVTAFVEYLDQRIFLDFAVDILSHDDRTADAMGSLGFNITILDGMIDPSPGDWDRARICNELGEEIRYYPPMRPPIYPVRAVFLGYAVYFASSWIHHGHKKRHLSSGLCCS